MIDPFIATDLKLPEMDKAEISFTAELENISDKDLDCALLCRLLPDDRDRTVTVTVPAKSRITVKDTFTLADPKVWWPVGLGERFLL